MHISTCKIVKENKCTPTDNVVKIHIRSENLIINPPINPSEVLTKNAKCLFFPFCSWKMFLNTNNKQFVDYHRFVLAYIWF